MGWWITLGIVTLLAILPLGVRVLYDADGAVVKIVLGPVKITVFPRTEKEKKPPKEKPKKTGKKAPSQDESLPQPPQPPPKPKGEKKNGCTCNTTRGGLASKVCQSKKSIQSYKNSKGSHCCCKKSCKK